jgi:hypothetical protein
VKLDGNLIKIEVVNVIMPIPFGEIPDDFVDLLEVKFDGETIIDSNKMDNYNKALIIWNKKSYPLSKIRDVGDGTLPLGDKFVLAFPNIKNWKKGETHEFHLRIQIANGIELKFSRKLN